MTPLDPAPFIEHAHVKFMALSASRSDRGINATVQIINGDVRAAETLLLSSVVDRHRSATLVAPDAGISVDDAATGFMKLVSAVDTALTQARPQKAEGPRRSTTSMTLPELMQKQFSPPRFAVEGVLQEGCTLFCGRPKSGKSWIMLHMALAVAAGGHAFGQIPVERGSVLYLALEDGERLLQTRFQKLLKSGAAPANLHLACEWPRLDEGGMEALDAWLKVHDDTRLVIVDTFAKVRPDADTKQSIYKQDYDALSPLTELSHMHRVALTPIHHTRKSEAEDVMDTVSGSTGLTAASDAVVVLQRARFGQDVTLAVTGRDILEHEMALQWDTALASWSYAGEASEVNRTKEQKELIQIIKDAGVPCSPQDVTDRCDRNYNAVKMALSRMTKEGLLLRVDRKYTLTQAAEKVTPFMKVTRDEPQNVTKNVTFSGPSSAPVYSGSVSAGEEKVTEVTPDDGIPSDEDFWGAPQDEG